MRRVYVGRLNHDVRERDVEKFFRPEGSIKDIIMKDGFAFIEFDHPDDADAAVRRLNGRSLLGDRVLVEFAKGTAKARSRMAALERSRSGDAPPRGGDNRNGRGYRDDRDRDRDRDSRGGRSSGLSYAEKYGPPRNTDYRVIVENLSSQISWQDLKDQMRKAGEVTFADAHKRERNIGVVDFACYKDMKTAIELFHDTELEGRRIKVYEDRDKDRRGRGSDSFGAGTGGHRNSRRRSRSRSPSRSRTRSRSRSKSRTRSPAPRRSRVSRSRSRSRSRSVSKNRGNAISRSRSRSRSNSASNVRVISKRGSSNSPNRRSPSPARSRSRSPAPKAVVLSQLSKPGHEQGRDRSRSRSRSRSGSKSKSGSRSGSESGSRSRSEANNDSQDKESIEQEQREQDKGARSGSQSSSHSNEGQKD